MLESVYVSKSLKRLCLGTLISTVIHAVKLYLAAQSKQQNLLQFLQTQEALLETDQHDIKTYIINTYISN